MVTNLLSPPTTHRLPQTDEQLPIPDPAGPPLVDLVAPGLGQTIETTAILRILAAAGVVLSPIAVDRPWLIGPNQAGTLILAEGYLLVAGLIDAQLTHLPRTAPIAEAIDVLSRHSSFELRPGNPAYYFTFSPNILNDLGP